MRLTCAMRLSSPTRLFLLLLTTMSGLGAGALPAQSGAMQDLRLDAATHLTLHNGRVEWVEHGGRAALHLVPLVGHEHDTDQELSADLVGVAFTDGVIEVDVSGARREGYATDDASAFKGFIGVSFRVRGDTAERFYVRPENAHHPDEVFRNRATQYEASPDWPWNRLRQERPGAYESHAEMVAGDWTHLRIEVSGTTARLFVNRAATPALVVTDLRNGTRGGGIALWTRISSDAYFSNLRIEAR